MRIQAEETEDLYGMVLYDAEGTAVLINDHVYGFILHNVDEDDEEEEEPGIIGIAAYDFLGNVTKWVADGPLNDYYCATLGSDMHGVCASAEDLLFNPLVADVERVLFDPATFEIIDRLDEE